MILVMQKYFTFKFDFIIKIPKIQCGVRLDDHLCFIVKIVISAYNIYQ